MTNKFILGLIGVVFLVAIFIRVSELDKVFPHLSNDEISIAYDAYSVSSNGMDEHGKFLPISFASHGTFKAPLYTYILAIFFKIYDNSDLIVKLPSVIAGVLTVMVVGLLAYELSNNKWLGIMSGFVMAVSPAHIITSRMARECNLALLFFTLGIYLFFRSLNNGSKPILLIFSAISFVLSMYSYHTEWVLTPVIALLLVVQFLFNKRRKLSIIFIGICVILSLPLMFDYVLNMGTGARANTEMIWNDVTIQNAVLTDNSIIVKVSTIINVVISNYAHYINLGYIFFDGKVFFDGSHPYKLGLFLWPFLFVFIAGFVVIKKIINPRMWKFFVLWTLLSPVVPALTIGETILYRNLVSIVPYSIIIGAGMLDLFKKRPILMIVFLFVILGNLVMSGWTIFKHVAKVDAKGLPGYKPIAIYLKNINLGESKVFIDYRFGGNNLFIGVPHLYFGFYQKWDPSIIQQRQILKDWTVYGNYNVMRIDWSVQKIDRGDFYAVPVANSPPDDIRTKLDWVSDFQDEAGISAFEVWRGR